jgi:type VI secretion system protein
MVLLLRIGEPSVTDGNGREVEVDTVLRIGRAADNELVLPDADRVLSKQHCIIRREEGRYVLLDSSTNGTFLNDSPDRLASGHAVPLVAGDDIHLGPFTLSVVSVVIPDRGEDPAEIVAEPLGPVSHAPAPVFSPQPSGVARTSEDIDLFLDTINRPPGAGADDFLGESAAEAWHADPRPVGSERDHMEPDADAFSPPRPHREAIPDDWDPLAEIGSAEPRPDAALTGRSDPDAARPDGAQRGAARSNGDVPGLGLPNLPHLDEEDPLAADPGSAQPRLEAADAVEPAAPPLLLSSAPVAPTWATPAPVEGDRHAVDLLLTACGLDPTTLTDAQAAVAAERAGHLLRIAVDGMLQILGSRSVTKQEFGMQRTAISRGANNALKFVTTAEEALRMLLCNDIPGFLPPEAAMRETVTDINAHHLALLSGVRTAFADMVRRLDPAAIEQTLPRHATDSVVPALRKARAWDVFRTIYAELECSLGGDGHDVFGNEFARAYASAQAAATRTRNATAEILPDAL